ncbi:MAG: Holliday junction resolvase RuvX [Bacteroidia bacterium]|nr:Holliday junction resolvase RuvX [Bacteroidia bacterium]
MPRILAIDYGLKRCGIAVSDPLRIIATPLTTVAANELFPFLTTYFETNEVDTIVIGLPKRLDNTDTHSTSFVLKAIDALNKKYPTKKTIPLDERFTSKIALNAMIAGGTSKKNRANKATIDQISATIILQDYMRGI